MAKFTKRIQLALTPEMSALIRRAAQQQKVSVCELVRVAVARYLGDLGEQKQPSLLDTPVVLWTREEEETADRAMKLFLNHDE